MSTTTHGPKPPRSALAPRGTSRATSLRGDVTEADLNAAVAEVHARKADAAGSYWQLGESIRKIHAAQLWKLRVGEGRKKHRYSSFNAFAVRELQLSTNHAYRLIAIAQNFTEEDARQISSSKLGLLVGVPKEDAEHLKAKLLAAPETSYRDLAAETTRIKAATKHQKPTLGGKAMPHNAGKRKALKDAAPPSSSAGGERITVAVVAARHRVPLYKKPASLKDIDLSTLGRARDVSDQPFGRIELTNEVSLLFAIVRNANGELTAVVELRRDTHDGPRSA